MALFFAILSVVLLVMFCVICNKYSSIKCEFEKKKKEFADSEHRLKWMAEASESEAKAKISKIRKELSEAEDRWLRLETDKLDLQTKVAKYSESIMHSDMITQSLNTQNRNLEDKVQKLKEQNQSLQEENHTLQNAWTRLQRDKEDLQAEMVSFQRCLDQLRQLTQQNEDMQKTIKGLRMQNEELQTEINILKGKEAAFETRLSIILSGNLKAFPYLAGMIADYKTYELAVLAKKLDWGYDTTRAKKVKSIREIKRDATEKLREAKIAEYQLYYLLELYPALKDILDEDYEDIKDDVQEKDYTDYDPVRDYLTKEQWENLSTCEKNQIALDNYINSRSKSKWQIGRDYELFIGFQYEEKGYEVEYFGEMNGLEDLGRDLICRKFADTKIVQCKYWGQIKTIHEKHLYQLYGTTITYCIEHNLSLDTVTPVFVTNIHLSEMAHKVAQQLNIEVIEDTPLGEFPRIKCNKNGGAYNDEWIYHLPMDQQYDRINMTKSSTEWATTVAEAEAKGYRRAYKWHGQKD